MHPLQNEREEEVKISKKKSAGLSQKISILEGSLCNFIAGSGNLGGGKKLYNAVYKWLFWSALKWSICTKG